MTNMRVCSRKNASRFFDCTPSYLSYKPGRLKHRWLHIIAEDRAEDIHDLAKGSVGLHGLDDRGHGVLRALGHAAQLVQRVLDCNLIAFAAQPGEALQVRHRTYPSGVG